MKLKLALFTIAQLTILSCSNEEARSDGSIKKELDTNYGSIYDGPSTKLSVKQNSSPTEKTLPTIFVRSKRDLDCSDITEDQFKVFGEFHNLGKGSNLMWPGNLIQGNSIKTGELAAIPVSGNGRNPIEVKVDAFALGSANSSSKILEAPTAGSVQTALEKILEGYHTSGTKFPADYSIDIRRAFNSKQLQLALNVGFTGKSVALSASFGLNFKKNKTYYAVTLKQRFFNVSVNPDKTGLQGDFGWIKKDYPQSEVSKFMSESNPPVYISSVTYGRLYALVYESDENSLKIEQALKFAYNNPKASISVEQKSEYSSILQNSKVYVKQFGGNATAGLESSLGSFAGNFDSVRDFIVKGAEVSKDNPGYPIEYTAVNVNSNLPVTIKVEENVKYSECKKNPYIANSYEDARRGVDKLKSEYGVANSAKIIIYNNTDQNIILNSSTPWYESSFFNTPPSNIPPGKYGFVLAVHKTGAATGTFNQLSYQLDNKIVSFGTYAPWSQFKTNNVLVDFKEITENELYDNSVRPAIEKTDGMIRIKGSIDTGDSPFVTFTINK
ncbi:thiol-activated cytolysin family protein [Elizabethkingia miricola]|uniref:thiol-activated cytolysin family protein n=2 Tax=Elizabethkingia miricola TaxID=172045 RepID=UPI0023E17131|nr:thiol-activated cytolysin family protein [Elizabethkingia miricola]WER13856.1 thiol-activated cytolysin family protein [Elizabethkingia miricola]WGL74033.1 thiol-activated cytolysin family protein [Elizabethkingia miricola]